MTPLARARAAQREIEERLAVERDTEMCAFYEQVLDQWTIEIRNLKRSRSLCRRIGRVFRTRSRGLHGALLLASCLRAWRFLGGFVNWRG